MLHVNFEDLKFDKCLVEVRFKEVFSLPTKKYEILDALQDKYPSYNLDMPDAVTLFNPEEGIQINVELNRIICNWDNARNFSEFSKLSQRVINSISKILKVETYNRVGIRSFLSSPVKSPEEAFTYIINRYFSTQARDTDIIADEIANPIIRFSGRKGQLFYNFGLNYQQQHLIQAEIGIGNALGQKVRETNNSVLLYDIDAYRNNVSKNRISNLFTETESFIDENLMTYLKRVEG